MVDVVQVGDVRADTAKQAREGLGGGAVIDHLSKGAGGAERISR